MTMQTEGRAAFEGLLAHVVLDLQDLPDLQELLALVVQDRLEL